jgi:hypothetical protein
MELALANGFTAQVDDEDYPKVSDWKWRGYPRGNTVYVGRCTRENGKNKFIQLHRFIAGVSDRKIQIDHIDGDGLNNRRANLRECNNQQNQANTRKRTGEHTSQFKGVDFHKKYGKWRASIKIDGKAKFLGYFSHELEAAKAYQTAAESAFGEFYHRF